MTKRKTKLPVRYQEKSITSAPSTRQSSRQPSTVPQPQRDLRRRNGSTFSPEPIKIALNDTIAARSTPTNPPYLASVPTTQIPTHKPRGSPATRPTTTKKRKTPAREVDNNYVLTPPYGRTRSGSRSPTNDDETEHQEAEFASDDSFESNLQRYSEDQDSTPPGLQTAGSTLSIIGMNEIQLDGDWFADDEVPPIHPGRAKMMKSWELKQYIRRSDETSAKISKLLRDTEWLEDVGTTKREGVPNFAELRHHPNEHPMVVEGVLDASVPLPSFTTSTSANSYLSPLPQNIPRSPSPTIAALRASGGGLLGKAPITSTAAVRWVMQPQLATSATPTPAAIPSPVPSREPSPLPSPSFRLKLDSHYHASIGTATPPHPSLPTVSYPAALRTGNDYSNPRGFPHTPPRVRIEFDFPVENGVQTHRTTLPGVQDRAIERGRRNHGVQKRRRQGD